jgi:hypothetical protein
MTARRGDSTRPQTSAALQTGHPGPVTMSRRLHRLLKHASPPQTVRSNRDHVTGVHQRNVVRMERANRPGSLDGSV